MPVAVGVGLGLDGVRYAMRGLRLLTERQARALEAALAPHYDAKCFIAMRYWNARVSRSGNGGCHARNRLARFRADSLCYP